jgi:two-component system, NarL family, nitrate/nitrite response regulator NarL
MTITTILADDHPIFRDGLLRSLAEGGFEVLGAGGTADEAVALAEAHRPALAILDVSMPGGGIEAARRIRAVSPATRIAMLTVSEADRDVAAALGAGAIGYVLKGVSADELVAILTGVAHGEAHVSPGLAVRLIADMERPRRSTPRRPIDELSKREEDILRHVAQGLSNREVAEALSLQEKTVKHYMTSILEKLQARNRVEAALIAREAWGDQG